MPLTHTPASSGNQTQGNLSVDHFAIHSVCYRVVDGQLRHAAGRRIIDLSGYADLAQAPAAEYEGICW